MAFIVLWDCETHFEVELVEANRAIPTEIKGGAALLSLIDDMSKRLGYGKIMLYSVQNRISYYQKMRYERTGETITNPVYGILTRMVKYL